MNDSDKVSEDEQDAKRLIKRPDVEEFFDPWEEEFRQNFSKDDKAFDF
jgi:hypothetical protein